MARSDAETIAIGADHGGYHLKQMLIEHLAGSRGWTSTTAAAHRPTRWTTQTSPTRWPIWSVPVSAAGASSSTAPASARAWSRTRSRGFAPPLLYDRVDGAQQPRAQPRQRAHPRRRPDWREPSAPDRRRVAGDALGTGPARANGSDKITEVEQRYLRTGTEK